LSGNFGKTIFRRLGLLVGLALAGAICFGGCGVQEIVRGELQPPRVTFQGLNVYPPTAQGWPLAAVLLLQNPNPQPINLLGYDYELWLEGQSVAQGVSQEAVYLPASGQATAMLPIVVKLPALTRLWPALLRPKQKLHYQIAGGFRLASLLGGLLRVPFRFQGEFTSREGVDLLKPYLRNFPE
jgi:hypothetical protein